MSIYKDMSNWEQLDFKKTEHLIRRHFDSIGRYERMLIRSHGSKAKIKQLETDIKDCNFKLENPLKGVSYEGERVQTSKVSKPIEEALIQAYEDAANELAEEYKEDKKLSRVLIDMKTRIDEMTHLIESVPNEADREAVRLYYSNKKMSLRKLASLMSYGHNTVKEHRDKGVAWIMNELNDSRTDSVQEQYEEEEKTC